MGRHSILSAVAAFSTVALLGLTACGGEKAEPPTGAGAPPPTAALEAVAPAPGLWDALLQRHVHGDYVDYAGWKRDPRELARLDAFLRWQAEADPASMSREEQIAFWINAYNSTNVKMILDHYPVHTPMDIPGYFDQIRHEVAGEQLTVSQIEYDRLIAAFKDMRAHFAVVCSDRGCLPIRPGAWSGATLDADLDAAARRFVSDERHFKIDREKNEVWISKIFEWYGQKFTQDPTRPAERPELFVRYWLNDEDRKYLEEGKYELRIIEWAWTLNEKP